MIRRLRLVALVGAVLVVALFRRSDGVPVLVLMLAPATIVPLGLALRRPELSGAFAPAETALAWLAPFGALGGVLGWLAPVRSGAAVAGASAHVLVCFVAGAIGCARAVDHVRRRESWLSIPTFSDLASDVGLLLLPVGGVWFFAARVGEPLLGFHEPIVTFTAAHFHYAGFAAPTILGGVGRTLASDASRREAVVYRIATGAVCLGVPLTALGIATNRTIESAAAIALASGMLCASTILVFAVARRAARRSYLAAVLFVVSGSTLLLTMSLAATFATTASAGRGPHGESGAALAGIVPLQTMMEWHGAANAIGFSLAGLVALTLLSVRPPEDARGAG